MMTPAARIRYHSTEWPAACEAQGWDVKDAKKRRNVVLDCMFLVNGPCATTSEPAFRSAETTALFCYLRHLADTDNITLRLRWEQCMADYVAFNTARQADYWQTVAYGDTRGNRLIRRRFDGARSAAGYAAEDGPNPTAARHRLMTMRERARKTPRTSKSTPALEPY